jgi:hypothetical protein
MAKGSVYTFYVSGLTIAKIIKKRTVKSFFLLCILTLDGDTPSIFVVLIVFVIVLILIFLRR